ncbi:MAG: Tol-Pal system beta propeller repeat protein TolB [Proteobacteria bacterium]|nr:Tol-Pal system beta propeller repeat protein TolB [Pseudomonadota bacterium]MBU1739634.1 Tol-Pal system beta propeller repeat protein TolB [Pseudomonadota bacterium]
MKNLLIKTLFTLSFLLCMSSARAAIIIDVTSAELRKVPTAVPFFININRQEVIEDRGREMAALLAEALVFHGFISIIPPDDYGGVQTANWLDLAADFAVLGNYQEDEKGLVIEVRLIDVTTGRMILGRRYRGKADKIREMILKFCDEIIFKMTGDKGVSRTSIAFVSDKTGSKEIYITDIFGDQLRQVTKHKGIAVSPRFSPDGRYLSYTSYHKGNPNLYITDLSQSKVTTPISQRRGLNMAPAWHPDGTKMAVTLSPDGNPDLYLIDTSGNILSRLTEHEGINVSPSWSPDGRRLAFVSDRSGSPQIYVMDVNTRTAQRITFVGSYNTTPSWSPDNNLIAYSGHYENMYHIYVISPEGGRPTRLTRFWGDHESPSWSPDSRQIVFSRRRGDEQNICSIFRNGSGFKVLFDWDGEETMPQWSPREER